MEKVADAGNQLASIARSVHAVGGGLAGRLLKKVVELQAEAHDLTKALADLRGSLRRATAHVLTHDSAIARPGRSEDFGTPEWLKRVSVTIDPRTTKVTTGLVFDSAGHQIKIVESGRDELSRSAQIALAMSRQFPKPPGWRPGDELAVADHVETKIATWLLRTGIPMGRRHVTVVINKDKPCGRPYGCQVAVRAILPRGASVTVVSSVTGLSWVLKGVAPS